MSLYEGMHRSQNCYTFVKYSRENSKTGPRKKKSPVVSSSYEIVGTVVNSDILYTTCCLPIFEKYPHLTKRIGNDW